MSVHPEQLSEADYLRIARDRYQGARWTIYVCAEPDGERCVSGTHPNICRHECAALTRRNDWLKEHDYHATDEMPPGPQIVTIEVCPVEELPT